MSNIVYHSVDDAVRFHAKTPRGMHSTAHASLDMRTRYLFDQRIQLPSEPGRSFVDLGCGSGEALLLALRRGFRRPVVGVDYDPTLLRYDTKVKLAAAGFVTGVDFILISVDLSTAGAAATLQQHLSARNPPAPSSFDVVLAHQIWNNTPCARRQQLLSNCIQLGRQGGTLHFVFTPRYGEEAVAPNARSTVQQQGNDKDMSPASGAFFEGPALAGPPSPVHVVGAITTAPRQFWVDAENQARVELSQAGLQGGAATFLTLGDGREFGLPAGSGPPAGARGRLRPYGFTAQYRGHADWSAHWTQIALARPSCRQPNQSPANRTWNLINEGEEMMMDVISDSIMMGMLNPTRLKPKFSVVEVMATIRL